jgi:hypothetical protein
MLKLFDNVSKIYLAQNRVILSVFLYCYFWKMFYRVKSRLKGWNILCLELKGMRIMLQTLLTGREKEWERKKPNVSKFCHLGTHYESYCKSSLTASCLVLHFHPFSSRRKQFPYGDVPSVLVHNWLFDTRTILLLSLRSWIQNKGGKCSGAAILVSFIFYES